MPMTFSGDGAITGLVAGGLPDNVVLTNEIVDGAVTTAKLGANSVTTNGIVDGAVTTAKLGSSVASGLCKAWVNFNGTGTVAIRASYNVSSITDSGTGDYTVNFTTAMADANYAVAWSWGGTGGALTGRTVEDITPRTALLVRLVTANTAGALLDPAQVNISIFR